KSIRDADAERKLWPDNREIDPLARGDVQQLCRTDKIGRQASSAPGNSGVPRGADHLGHVTLDAEPGDERVLARAAAADEHSHSNYLMTRSLGRSTGLHTVGARAGLFR